MTHPPARVPKKPCPRCGHKICTCLVDTLIGQLKQADIPEPEREVRFAPGRRWAFDLAWPYAMVSVEVEGGTWTNGGHSRGKGYEQNCEKYATAAIMGWMLLRFTTDMIADGRALNFIELALRSKGVKVGHETTRATTGGVKYPVH